MTLKDNENTTENAIVVSQEESLFSGLPAEALQQVNPAKLRMINLYLTGMYTMKKIASIIGVHESTVRVWLMQEPVQQIIQCLQEKEFQVIDSNLKSMRHKAIDTMSYLMDSPLDQIRYSASKDILDRTGHKAAQQISVNKTVTTIEQQLKDIKDFNFDESQVIDVDDIVEVVKNGK